MSIINKELNLLTTDVKDLISSHNNSMLKLANQMEKSNIIWAYNYNIWCHRFGVLGFWGKFMKLKSFSITALTAENSARTTPIWTVVASSSPSESSSPPRFAKPPLAPPVLPPIYSSLSFIFASLFWVFLAWMSSTASPRFSSTLRVNRPIMWMYFRQVRTTASLFS